MMIRKLHKKTTEIKQTLVWRGGDTHFTGYMCTGIYMYTYYGTVGREGLVH